MAKPSPTSDAYNARLTTFKAYEGPNVLSSTLGLLPEAVLSKGLGAEVFQTWAISRAEHHRRLAPVVERRA